MTCEELTAENARLRAENERLEKELDWFANQLEEACYKKEEDVPCLMWNGKCPDKVHEHMMCNVRGQKTCKGATAYGWREAASQAVKEGK